MERKTCTWPPLCKCLSGGVTTKNTRARTKCYCLSLSGGRSPLKCTFLFWIVSKWLFLILSLCLFLMSARCNCAAVIFSPLVEYTSLDKDEETFVFSPFCVLFWWQESSIFFTWNARGALMMLAPIILKLSVCVCVVILNNRFEIKRSTAFLLIQKDS